MSKNNKKNKGNNPIHKDDTFDVRKNLKKLRQGHTNYNASQTESDYSSNQSEPISSLKSTEGFSGTYGANFTESMFNRYDKLKDELNFEVGDIKAELSNNSQEIRKELNDKFHNLDRDKLSISWFWKIISGLVGFLIILASVIYTLSLKDFKEKIDGNSNKIENLEDNYDKLSDLESELKTQKNQLNKIDSTVTKEKNKK